MTIQSRLSFISSAFVLASIPAYASHFDNVTTSDLYIDYIEHIPNPSGELPYKESTIIEVLCSGAICSYYDPLTEELIETDFSSMLIGNVNLSPRTLIMSNNNVHLYQETNTTDGEFPVEYNGYGAWLDDMDYSMFGLSIKYTDYLTIASEYSYYTVSGGDLSNTQMTGDLTWSGVMVGMDRNDFTPQPLVGNAVLSYDFSDDSIDATFSAITNLNTNSLHSTPIITFFDVETFNDNTFYESWSYVSYSMTSQEAGSSYIKGGIYGPNHDEISGVFRVNSIIGAFGAKLD